MLVYLLGFAASAALIALGEKKKTKYFLLLSALGLLIPCLIAAFRAPHIGTDTTVYLKPLTQAAVSADNIGEFFRTYWYYVYKNVYVEGYELGFSLLVYFAAKSTASLIAVQFTVAATILVPIFITLARNRKQIPVWLGMLVFYLFFFNSTLNMMRQWMAMSFLLLAFQLITERKWGGAIILSIVAMLFHLSSILGFAVFLVYWLLHLVRNKSLSLGSVTISGQMLIACLLSAVSLLVLFNLQPLQKLISSLGLNRFANYLKGDKIHLMPMQILLRLPVILLFLVHWKQFRRSTPLAAFFMAMLLLDVVAAQLISIEAYSFRIGYYFTVYLLLGIPMLYRSIPCPTKRAITTVIFILYLLFYWYYNYVLQMRHQTVPYEFLNVFQ